MSNDTLFSTVRAAVKSGALPRDLPYLEVIASIENGACDDVAGAVYWLTATAKSLLPTSEDATRRAERQAEFHAENAVTGFPA